MKVTLLGGGGFRVPLTFAALRRAARRLDLRELVLHDVDGRRLAHMCQLLEALEAESFGPRLAFRATTDLTDALHGAAFVLCAIRVGGLEARLIDERVPLEHGVVGQETVGPGGLNLVLRSVPVLSAIAQAVAREAPDAWFINFTNPVGVMTGVLRGILGDRVIGVCDTPVALCQRVAAVLGRNPAELYFDYFGLNHLGWLRSVRFSSHRRGRDLLPGLLADDAKLGQLVEGRLFGPELIRDLRMLPSEYLTYYYFPRRQLQAVASSGQSRAEYLVDQQQLWETATHTAPVDALITWRAIQTQRERSYMAEARPCSTTAPDADWAQNPADHDEEGYAGVAVTLLEALATNARTQAIINLANRGNLPFLEDDAIVELPSSITAGGPVACTLPEVPEHCRLLMQRVHSAEQAAVDAVSTPSRSGAIEALALHPLVDSTDLAERIFNGYLQLQPDLAAQFA